jgi:hypothetical protein
VIQEILRNPLLIVLAISGIGVIIISLVYLFGSSANVRARMTRYVACAEPVEEVRAARTNEELA